MVDGLPLEGGVEPRPTVELAVRAVQRVPSGCGGGEVPEDPLAGGVVLEPRLQPRPRPGHRLVSELDRVDPGGHQPRPDQQRDDLFAFAITGQGPCRNPAPDGSAVGRQCDQSQQHATQDRSPPGGQAVVQLVGGSGDRPTHLAGAPVALQGHDDALTPAPGFGQGVRQHREGSRFSLGVAGDDVDQAALELVAGVDGRLFDGLTQGHPRERAEEVHAPFGEAPRAAGRRTVPRRGRRAHR